MLSINIYSEPKFYGLGVSFDHGSDHYDWSLYLILGPIQIEINAGVEDDEVPMDDESL